MLSTRLLAAAAVALSPVAHLAAQVEVLAAKQPSGSIAYRKLALDAAGNSYVASQDEIPLVVNKPRVSKWDASGALVWSVVPTFPPGAPTLEASDLALAPNGNVYLALISLSVEPGLVAIQAFDADGNSLWMSGFPTSGKAYDGELAVDAASNAIWSASLSWPGAGRDITSGAFDANGAFVWSTHYALHPNKDDDVAALGACPDNRELCRMSLERLNRHGQAIPPLGARPSVSSAAVGG